MIHLDPPKVNALRLCVRSLSPAAPGATRLLPMTGEVVPNPCMPVLIVCGSRRTIWL